MEQTKLKNHNNETLKAGCVVINDHNEVLLVSKSTETIWTFPKGHQEIGETAEQAATREVLEETGYEVKIMKKMSDLFYVHGKTGEVIRVAMFLAMAVKGGHPKEKETKSRWFDLDNAKKNTYHNLAFLLNEIN